MSNKKRAIIIIAIILGAALLSLLINLTITLISDAKYPRKHSDSVEKYASEYNVPEYVIYAVIDTESNFDEAMRAEDGSLGLMQMNVDVFKKISAVEHLNESLPFNDLTNPHTAIRYGAYYLRYLFNKYGNWDLAFTAYCAGELKTAEWLANPQYSKNGKELDKIPDKETEKYVKKVNDAIDYYKDKYYRNGVSVK